jgi:hypothetical protein
VEQLQWLSQFGFGAVACGVLFMIYRADRKHSEERWEKLASDFKGVIEHNTEAMTRLVDKLS